jgi:hypothetical protein
MKASEKVELIKRIGQRLATESWTDIDLTLGQFQFPPPSLGWLGGDKYSYCIERVQQGDDDSLLALGAHFFGEQPNELTPIVKDLPWAPNRFRLFLSHLSAEKRFVASIKMRLAEKAVDCFVAHEDIEPTTTWVEQIEAALGTCDALAAILTEGFHRSEWTDQEIGVCVNRRVLIIPVRLGLDPYGFIGRYQALTPIANEPEIVAQGIFRILCKHELTAEKMSKALVSQFADSGSFADVRVNVRLLDEVARWTPNLLREIEQAVEKNRQVRDSFRVPEIVRAIVERHRK